MRALTAWCAVALAAAPALAHRSLVPRRLELRLAGASATLVVHHELDEATSHAVVERFDRDADGRLSEPEEASAATWIAERTRREISLASNAVAVQLRSTSATLATDERGGSDPDMHAVVTVVLEGQWPSPCPCALELRDARLGDPATIPVTIVGSHEAEALLTAGSPAWRGACLPIPTER